MGIERARLGDVKPPPLCPTCGVESEATARFCASCGSALFRECPRCATETSMKEQLCPSCGQQLDLAILKEERKLVTVLFADLVGSTALGERLDPERLRILLSDYFSAMAAVVEIWGGTVEKFAGDAVMAVFGIPAAHEDDPERALQAALGMHSRLQEMNPKFQRRHGVELVMRVGVNTGEVMAEPSRDQFMVTGDAVNVAARLQQSAEPGEVTAGQRTYLATRAAFVFEPLEEMKLKGKSDSVPAWRVVERAIPLRIRRPVVTAARLIGREPDVARLEALYRRTVEDLRPGLVLIQGEAGVGKSRLVEEFVVRTGVAGPPRSVYRGRCLPFGDGITYWALQEVLWDAADIHLDDSAAETRYKLERFVRRVLHASGLEASDADRVLFALAKAAGISLPDNPLDGMSPESVGEELSLAWPRFVSSLAAQQPLLIVFEDLHSAEPPLLDMIEHLVARATGSAFIIATARPEFAELRPTWSLEPGMSQIELGPLSDTASHQLVEELVPRSSPRIGERVSAMAEGIPLFAEEIVAHFIDTDVLHVTQSGIVEIDSDLSLQVPDTVRGLLAARVDSLSPEEKLMLQDASVIGRNFWTTALEWMRGRSGVGKVLHALEERALVVTNADSSLPGQTELSFRHGLTREVAYRSIPRRRRCQLHAEVGRWIEQLTGDRREEYVDLIAYHFESAANPDDAELAWPADSSVREEIRRKALSALLDAGRAATSRFAIDEALGFGGRALVLATSEAERLASLEVRAQAAHAAVRADEAWRYYTDGLKVAEQIGDDEAVARLRASATLLWSRYAGAFNGEDWKKQAAEIVRRGLEEADGTATFETGALLVGRAEFAYWGLAPWEMDAARRDAEHAVQTAEEIGSPMLHSYALDALLAITEKDGFCNLANVADRMLSVARRIDDRVEAHEILVNAAIALSQARRWDDAVAAADAAVQLAADLGSHRRLHAGAAQTSCLLPAGRIEDLGQATRAAPRLVEEEEMHTCIYGVMALAGQVVTAFEMNEEEACAEALEVLDTARTSFQDTAHGFQFWTVDILRPLLGTNEFRRRLAELEAPANASDWIYMLRAELQVCALEEEWDKVDAMAAKARGVASAACAPSLLYIAEWADSVRLAASGHPVEALGKTMRALASLEHVGEPYTAARLLADVVPFLDGAGRQKAAGEAARRLEAMGARASAAEARRAVRR